MSGTILSNYGQVARLIQVTTPPAMSVIVLGSDGTWTFGPAALLDRANEFQGTIIAPAFVGDGSQLTNVPVGSHEHTIGDGSIVGGGSGNIPVFDDLGILQDSGTELNNIALLGHGHSLSDISDAGSAAELDYGTEEGNVPQLSTGGKLPSSVIPQIAITDVAVVATQAEMLALSSFEPGDLAIRLDLNKTFVLAGDPSQLSDWIELKTPTDAVLSVAGQTGVVVLSKSDVGLSNVANSLQLVAASNLSDLQNASTARGNLGLGTAAVQNATTFANATHTHLSADITDATSAATANTVAKRTSNGSITFANVTATGLFWTDFSELTMSGLGSTGTDGISLRNSTAATVGAQVQMAPRIRLRGSGWKTNATAAAQSIDWYLEALPVTGAANATGLLKFGFSNNGGALVYPLTLNSDGSISVLTSANITTSLAVGTNATVGGTLGVTGATTLTGTLTLGASRLDKVVTLTDGATVNINAALGTIFQLDAAGSRTIAVPTNPTNGQVILLEHYANGGTRTPSFSTSAGGFAFTDAVPSAIATASGKMTTYVCRYTTLGSLNKWKIEGASTTS